MPATFFAMPLPPEMSDGVIWLGSHRLEDAEAHHAGEDDEMIRRFDGTEKATLEQMRDAMRRWIAMRAAGGPQFAYAMRDEGGVLMGGCELQRRHEDTAHVSYWLYPAFRGRGYATRALSLLCAEAAKLAGVTTIEADIAADNFASIGVATRNGFVHAGQVQEETWRGETVTLERYFLSVSDFDRIGASGEPPPPLRSPPPPTDFSAEVVATGSEG